VITELDLLLPDPTLDLGDLGDLPLKPGHQKRNADITLDEDSYMSSIEQPRGLGRDDDLQLEEDILDIDIGEDREIGGGLGELMSGDSFEVGRDPRLPRDVGEDLFDESHLTMDIGDQETPKPRESVPPRLDFEEGLDLGFDEPMDFDIGADTTIQQTEVTPVPQAAPAPEQEMAEAPSAAAPEEHREHSESPLSSARSSIARDVVEESTYHEPVSEEVRRSPSEDAEPAHVRNHAASRKRKVVVDSVTEIKAKVIKAQQADRSRILKDPSFLPRDPTVLALMSLTKTGGLARSVFYPKNIAPELADLLAPDFVKRMAEMKRKRDAGEDKEEESPAKQPRLELEIEEPEEEVLIPEQPEEQEAQDETMEFGADISAVQIAGEEEELVDPDRRTASASPQPDIIPQGETSLGDITFETGGEPSFPAQPQPVSRETRHAVHVLREQFSEPDAKSAVHFQQLLPPPTTTRVDATKMFFEVLVLATKDAVQVTQYTGFGDIEIKQKDALWGAWAEEKDEQQVAEEEEERLQALEKETGRRREVVVGTGRTVGEATAAA